jgi:hypothetical protein
MNPIPIQDVKDRAIAVSKEHNPAFTSFTVTSVISHVLDGYMVTVTCQNQATEEDVFIHVTAESARRYYDIEELANLVGTYSSRPKTPAELFWDRVGFHGILAVLIFIVLAIVTIQTKGATSPPEYLLAAFSIIIGFYFGRFTKAQ